MTWISVGEGLVDNQEPVAPLQGAQCRRDIGMRDDAAVNVTGIDHDEDGRLTGPVQRFNMRYGMPCRIPSRGMAGMPGREHRHPLRLAKQPGQHA